MSRFNATRQLKNLTFHKNLMPFFSTLKKSVKLRFNCNVLLLQNAGHYLSEFSFRLLVGCSLSLLMIRKPRLGYNLSRAHCQLVKFTKSDLNSTASSYHSFTKLNCFYQKHFWMMLSTKEIWIKFNCVIVSQFHSFTKLNCFIRA